MNWKTLKNASTDHPLRLGHSLRHLFPSSFLLLPKGEKYVDSAAKSLEEELGKVKTEGDRSRHKRCCLYRDRAEDWPLRAPPVRRRGNSVSPIERQMG